MKSKFILPLLFLFAAVRVHAMDPDLGRFITSKQKQIRAFSDDTTNKVPQVVWSFFDAVRVDDWPTATNLAERITGMHDHPMETEDGARPVLRTLVWPPISESWGAYEQFHNWDGKWLHRFGAEVMAVIPSGSIYFGGTDPGRFVISAMCESQVEGKPFFTLTQNQFADPTYLEYLRAMYGKKIWIPAAEDSQAAFQAYMSDVQKRIQHDRNFPNEPRQLKPGEDVHLTEDGRVQVSGQIAVMEINGLLAKNILDHNPGKQFFIEESFALDWMSPYLVPRRLIFALNAKPLPALSEKDVAADQEYWEKLTDEMLGPWLNEKTAVKEVCDFADKFGMGRNLATYKGDKTFAADESARKTFSKLRSSTGGLYAWRAEHAKDRDEKERMYQAADLAFRQSYAICPISPEAIYRYANLLLSRGRTEDAVLLGKTSARLAPDDEQMKTFVSNLMRYSQSKN